MRRFYTVPGNPADGFESPAMERAAKTWAGEWWKYGGGGNVWNAFTYDAGADTIILGTGNGSPWNHRIRSEGRATTCSCAPSSASTRRPALTGGTTRSIPARPGTTTRRWTFSWPIKIAGRKRQVLMTAPKNGFFYVIDRTNGKLISAEPIARVTWATHIDLETGRPVEVPGARYPNGSTFLMWPGAVGAHTWLPMAFSPKSGLAYVPVIETSTSYSDAGIDPKSWRRAPHRSLDGGVNVDIFAAGADPLNGTSSLQAWNPVTQKPAWKVPTPGHWNGGVLATAGDLVFQGRIDRKFNAYDAGSGRLLWSFKTEAPVLAPPITYSVDGRQYVTVLAWPACHRARRPSVR